jgi:hypothetical protein
MQIQYSLQDNGSLYLGNDLVSVLWEHTRFKDGAENHVITSFIDRTKGVDHARRQLEGVWMGYGRGRGSLSRIEVADKNEKRISVHAEWGDGKVLQTVSLFKNQPCVRIEYKHYGVNIVDIGAPGGREKGEYCIYGSAEWQAKRKGMTADTLRNEENEHNRLTDDLFPSYPFPLYRRQFGEGALSYKGHFILGIYNPENGCGFGRIFPVKSIDVIKLLWNSGFECFPCFGRPHEPFTGYLFLSSGGPGQILEQGKRIVDSISLV